MAVIALITNLIWGCKKVMWDALAVIHSKSSHKPVISSLRTLISDKKRALADIQSSDNKHGAGAVEVMPEGLREIYFPSSAEAYSFSSPTLEFHRKKPTLTLFDVKPHFLDVRLTWLHLHKENLLMKCINNKQKSFCSKSENVECVCNKEYLPNSLTWMILCYYSWKLVTFEHLKTLHVALFLFSSLDTLFLRHSTVDELSCWKQIIGLVGARSEPNPARLELIVCKKARRKGA